MCQAYEAERNFIVAGEHLNTIKGFAAARKGEPKTSNPHGKFSKYDREAWDQGWGCWHERVLPYALELKLKTDDRWDARKKFEKSGMLPKELESYL